MLRFTLLTCLMAFAATSQVFAQQSMEDVVHLKNGGVVRGIIIEQILGESLKIQTQDGNVLVFTMDEITRLSKEMPKVSSSTGTKAEIGTLLALSHARSSSYSWNNNSTRIYGPSMLSIWLSPYERWFEYGPKVNEFSLLFGLGTQLGG